MIKRIREYFYFKKVKRNLQKSNVKYGKNLKVYNVIFDNVYGNFIEIGNNCTMTNCIVLAHDASLNRFMKVTKVEPVKIGNNCFVGAGSVILPGVTLGDNTIVGAGAVVTSSFVAGNCVIAGNPARKIKDISEYVEQNKKQMTKDNVVERRELNNNLDKKLLYCKIDS